MNQKPNISVKITEEKKLFPSHLVQEKFNTAAPYYNTYNALGEEVASRLCSRLADLKRSFPTILDLGAGTGAVANQIQKSNQDTSIICLDFAEKMLQQNHHTNVIANAEDALPFKDETFDLAISNLCLPFINDIPKFLHLAGKALKKDGLFIATTLGLESFKEFKESFAAVGLGENHTFPLPDVRSVGSALQKRGFALPVIDRDIITVAYPNLKSMYEDLTMLGARNINPYRSQSLTGKNKWQKMEQYYKENFTLEDGSLSVTIEVIYLHGFRPHASQPKALKPGSGQKSIADVLTNT